MGFAIESELANSFNFDFPELRDEPQDAPSIEQVPFESAKAMIGDFYRCLRAGQTEVFNSMIEDGLLEQTTPQLNSALHIVARHGFHQLIEPIFDRRRGLLTQQNINGDLPLHLAAGAGHHTAVAKITELMVRTNLGRLCEMRNRDGDTALHLALRHRLTWSPCRTLVTAHPNASFCLNTRGESPLFLAAQLGLLRLVKIMTRASNANTVQPSGKSIVYASIRGGNSEVLKEILGKYPLLINSTIDLMNEGIIYPLSCAALEGNIQMVQYILNKFPYHTYKRDPRGTFPIHTAAGAGHILVLEEFLWIHPDSRELLTSDGQNILHMAALKGRDNVVSHILSQPDLDELINVRDNKGNTSLHIAVIANYPKVVHALTWDKRVRLDLVNNDGQTAMDLAWKFDKPMLSLKERLTWLALRYAGAPRRNMQQTNRLSESEQAKAETYKNRVGTLCVVATLVTTMSFAAGFTMPGGNSGSATDLGMSNFRSRRIFQLFVISNSIAFYSSVLDVIVLLFAMLGDVKTLRLSLRVAAPLLATSLVTMAISFMSSAYLVVSSIRWLGIAIWVLGSVFLAAVLTLFLLLFPSLSAKNQYTRYLAYLPFRAMLHLCERK